MAWTSAVAMVRTIIVRKRPATERGTAMAMDVAIASCELALPPLSASIMMMDEATEARAASGATAAPMLAQPKAIICSEPPRMMPSTGWPQTRPMSVQATRGWWNCHSSRMPSMPAKKATRMTSTMVIGFMFPPFLYAF